MADTPSPAPSRCGTCQQDPQKRFGRFGECSHIDGPVRPKCWSDGTGPDTRRPSADGDDLDQFEG